MRHSFTLYRSAKDGSSGQTGEAAPLNVPVGETIEAKFDEPDGKKRENHPQARAGSTEEIRQATEDTAERKVEKKKRKTVQVGDFKLIKKLGQGGMGEVFLAHQISLDRRVAFKTLSKRLGAKKSFIDRFYREARSMAKLDHPHVVRGYAVGEADGIHYVAMEYIDGQSLYDWLKKLKKLEIGDAVHIALRCAEALEHAHELNIIHRDIKPDNVLITRTGIVKVSDLGLAKALDDDMSMTQSGTGLGTPYYMPPEQARNAKYVDGRSDIYALGCMLYYCVTGAHPFEGDSTVEIITAKERGIFKSARRVNQAVPERLDLIIDKCLAKDPSHRYQTCNDLINDLDKLQMDVEMLSFTESAEVSPAAARASRSSARIRRSTPTTPTSMPPVAESRPSAAKKPVKKKTTSSRPRTGPSGGSAVSDGQWWYVQYRDRNGKKAVSKLRTAQVQQQLKAGNISTRAKGKNSADAAYAPLATFPEFLEIIERKLVEKRADQRKEQMANMYKKIDREEKWHRRFRGLRRYWESLLGGAGFLIYLVIIAGVLFALYLIVPPIIDYLQGNIPEFLGYE